MTAPTFQLPTLPQQLPQTQADWTRFLNILQQWAQALTPVPGYQAAFGSGYLQYGGPTGVTGNINFEVGTNLPNPSGTNAPGFLIGSGGGNGTPVNAWIITDQAYDALTPGNNLGITAGETQGSGTANGGMLFLLGGGSYGGTGGTLQLQGGTSANATGGPAILAGGNATNGGVPGDAYVIGGGGTVPSGAGQGANVHLIMTLQNGISGVVRIRVNSTPLIDFFHDGSIYLYLGGGFGTTGQHLTTQGAGLPAKWA